MTLRRKFWTRDRDRVYLPAAPAKRWTGHKKRLVLRSALVLCLAACVAHAYAQSLRVVAYNIDQDTGSSGVPGSDMTTVLQAIGNAHLAGNAQPIDVLALEELYGTPATTLQPIVTALNAIYPTANYTFDTTADATTGNFLTGNGPSGLIYNANTVQVLGALSVGSASGSGAPRAPMRYKLAPKGYNDHSADFFLYVSHMKSGSGSSDMTRRNVEANTIRTNSATTAVGANAHVIYSGDFNVNDSSETTYQTMISSSLPGIGTVGQAVDVLNPANNWSTTSTFKALLTESATFDQYRDDFQFVTNPMLSQPGMQLVPGSLTAFGNGGNIYHTSVTNSSNSAALADLGQAPYSPAYRSSVLSALTTVTDHLPIVADYSYATAVGAPGDFDHSGVVDTTDYNLWRSNFGSTTNLAADGNHNGVVDMADYMIWRDYAPGAGSGASLDFSMQVPEPGSCLLLLTGLCFVVGTRRRSQ
jgi:hypothetical protein